MLEDEFLQMSLNRTMRVSLAAFSVLLFSSVVGAQCPVSQLIKPCVCLTAFPTTVLCANFTDLHALQAIFDRSIDYSFETFFLQESQVMYLNATWLTIKNIQFITVQNSILTSLFDRIPNQVDQVSVINLVNSKVLRGIEWEQFQPFKNLLTLNMDGVEVRNLGKKFAKNMSPMLRDFKLVRSKTSQLDDVAFKNLNQLRMIQITHAEVKNLNRTMFARPSKLYIFDFSYNQIEIIPSDIFDEMPEIYSVFLIGNKIKTLPERACKGQFSIGENPLMCDCKMKWLPSRRCGIIDGSCDAPDTLNGKQLSQLTSQDFYYCKKRI